MFKTLNYLEDNVPTLILCLKCAFVGLLWGGTNPFLRKGSAHVYAKDEIPSKPQEKQFEKYSHTYRIRQTGAKHKSNISSSSVTNTTTSWSLLKSKAYKYSCNVVSLFVNWRFLIPFLINQLGSIAYVVLLGDAELSIVVPACNGFTFVCTAIVSRLMGEGISKSVYRLVVGVIFISVGVCICIASKK